MARRLPRSVLSALRAVSTALFTVRRSCGAKERDQGGYAASTLLQVGPQVSSGVMAV